VNAVREFVNLLNDVTRHFLPDGLFLRSVKYELRAAPNDPERIAQIVRQRGEELTHGREFLSSNQLVLL
jgi:hypothetical protein